VGNFWITECEKTHPEMHSSKVILHRDIIFGHFKGFSSMCELDKFANLLGFKYELFDTFHNAQLGEVKKYSISHFIDDDIGRSFWNLEELPNGAEKVNLVDNGDTVTCYFINDGAIIHLYRPNPNVRELHRIY
jgi:hypothetical protein